MVDLPVPRGWRVAVIALAGLAAAVLLAWVLAAPPDLSPALMAAVAGLAGACVPVALRLARLGPCRVSWDGEDWRLGAMGAPPDQLRPGRLRVMLDFSGAMLLRFDESRPGRGARHWIPVSRGALGAGWPAWRLTVYSAPHRPHAATIRPERHE